LQCHNMVFVVTEFSKNRPKTIEFSSKLKNSLKMAK
jgi:hypothetical protein